jgi:hypothetical protein
VAQRKHFTAQLIAVNSKSKIVLGIAAGLILAGSVLFFYSSSHLPRPQSPPAAGTLIPKNQLVFAGYGTPEATLESMFWANVNGNYEAAMASVPKDQGIKEFGKNPAQFKAESQHGEFEDFASLQIIARKNVSADLVELEFQELDKDENSNESEPDIATMMKVGKEWKLDVNASSDYTTNWDKGDNIITFVQRTNAPSVRQTNSFASKYEFGAGISISKKHLADAGYGTPEDAFETENWAHANTNYDRMIGSFSPEIQEKSKADPDGREHFEAQMSKFGFPIKTIHIAAKKMIADDKAELMIVTEQGQNNITFATVSIQQMIKAGDEWKVGDSKNYDPAWENDSQPEPTIQR